jgi:ribosomal protein L11 methyltransferase
MNWLKIHLDTNHAGLEETEAFLSSLGFDSVEIEDETEFREMMAQAEPSWGEADEALVQRERGRCRITFYLGADEGGLSQLAMVRMALTPFRREHPECAPLLLTLEETRSADWENSWKQYYKPAPVGRRLMIVPEWERSAPVPEGRVPLVLDPGLSFGTGRHATTRLCLEFLEELLRGGEAVADLGCGSGILSIAALKLGAARAFGCDIDDKCVEVAYANAALNGVGLDVYTVRSGDILTDEALRAQMGGGYQLVVANIVADVILGLAPAVRPLLAEDGVFLCSGVLLERADEVSAGLAAAGLTVTQRRESEGWCAFLCR